MRRSGLLSDLLVWGSGIDLRFGLVGPDALVERLQQRALQQGQGPLHLAPALPQGLLTLSHIPKAQRVELLHLKTESAVSRWDP